MDELIELKNNEEYQEMGSLNHSIVQAQITGLLYPDKRFRVMIELSLDVRAKQI
jgi:hypothetical protein